MAAPQVRGFDSVPGYSWPAAVTRVLAMAAALPLLNLLMIAVAVALTARWQKRRGQVQLASQKARWEGLAQSAAGFTVSESMTLGWLNVILRHVWPTLLEKEVAEAVTKQIQVCPHPPAAPLPAASPPQCSKNSVAHGLNLFCIRISADSSDSQTVERPVGGGGAGVHREIAGGGAPQSAAEVHRVHSARGVYPR